MLEPSIRSLEDERSPIDRERVALALAGEPESKEQVAAALLDIVFGRGAYVLRDVARRHRWDPGSEATALRFEFVEYLLYDRPQVLANWDPARGASLSTFILRELRWWLDRRLSGFRGNPRALELLRGGGDEDVEHVRGAERDPEAALTSSLDLHRVLEDLSAEDLALLIARYHEGQEVGALARDHGVPENTMSKRLLRLRDRVRALLRGEAR